MNASVYQGGRVNVEFPKEPDATSGATLCYRYWNVETVEKWSVFLLEGR